MNYTHLIFVGHYCDFSDQPISDYTSYPCPAGYFCPTGTEYATQHGCPAGSYSSQTMLETDTDCTACDAGKYCLGSDSVVTGQYS